MASAPQGVGEQDVRAVEDVPEQVVEALRVGTARGCVHRIEVVHWLGVPEDGVPVGRMGVDDSRGERAAVARLLLSGGLDRRRLPARPLLRIGLVQDAASIDERALSLRHRGLDAPKDAPVRHLGGERPVPVQGDRAVGVEVVVGVGVVFELVHRPESPRLEAP